MYDAVRHAAVPRERILEGLRGAILARGAAGIPLLMEQLQSNDRDYFNLGLRVARELPGRDGDGGRGGRVWPGAAGPAAAAVAGAGGSRGPRRHAGRDGGGREGWRERTCGSWPSKFWIARAIAPRCPCCWTDAADDDPEISDASLAAVTRMAGNEVDSELLARLPDSSGRMRAALYYTCGPPRNSRSAVPLVVQSLGDSDADMRGAAIQALTALGGNDEVAVLAQALEKTADSRRTRSH